MILGFKQYFPWKEPTWFMEKILFGVPCQSIIWIKARATKRYPKIHTMRVGNRWRSGMTIHMAIGVRTKNYHQFNKGIPELEKVKSIQNITIKVFSGHPNGGNFYAIRIDGGNELSRSEVEKLAINDGFSSIFEFEKWFNKDFEGQIIHWTDFKY